MENNKETWYKWDYVCTNCDSHIEMTIKSNGLPHAEICPNCNTQMTLMSVVDVTISNVTQKKEEEMITETPAQTMTLTWLDDDVETSTTYSESDIRALVWANKNLIQKQNEWYKKESQLRTLLEEVYADSQDQDTLSQIAEIFDVPLTKEIEVTAWVRVDMTIEVDMAEGDYDIEDLVRNNLSVDAYSPISVNDFDVDRVEEGAY